MSQQVKIDPAPRRVSNNPDGEGKKRKVSADALFALKLLDYENQVRTITDVRELGSHLCNSSREILPFNQSFFGTVAKTRKPFTLEYISSIPSIDVNSPFKIQFEKLINSHIKETGGLDQQCIDMSSLVAATEQVEFEQEMEYLWSPQVVNEQLVGGFIVCKNSPWNESEQALVGRLSLLYGHSRSAITGAKKLKPKSTIKKKIAMLALIALIPLAFLPVPISALAPVEVSPAKPFIITAPFDGVVETILPDQGQSMNEGDLVVKFDDMHLLNEKNLAEQRMAIASANYQRVSQSAIADPRVKRDIEVARAEFELAQSESDYASQLYQESQLVSPVNGVAIYSAKTDWEGKPVSAGEAIISIADPENVELTIYLPVKDSLVLEEQAKIRVFLDSDPLNPIKAELIKANYNASPDKRDILSYQLTAKITSEDSELPRIGTQGTAQVFGEEATLGYVVFRRPLSALRQITGW